MAIFNAYLELLVAEAILKLVGGVKAKAISRSTTFQDITVCPSIRGSVGDAW